MHWDIPSLRSEKFRKPEPPHKKCFFQALPRSFWSTSPWKPCVSASKWWINIFSTSFHCGLCWHLKITGNLGYTQGQTRFFSMGILEGVKRQTSRAAYNGPKQQCLLEVTRFTGDWSWPRHKTCSWEILGTWKGLQLIHLPPHRWLHQVLATPQ